VKQRYKEAEREVARVTISEGEEFYAPGRKRTPFYPFFVFFLSRNGLLDWAFSKQSRSRAWGTSPG